MTRNLKLNVGGVLGGLLGAGAVFALLFSPEADGKRLAKYVIAGVTVGAFAGNVVWAQLVAGGRQAATAARRTAAAPVLVAGRSCVICGASLAGAAPGLTLCARCRQQTS